MKHNSGLDKRSDTARPVATKSVSPTKLCGHPGLHPTAWGQERPAPAFMVGCIHHYNCPVCGFGQGTAFPHNPNCPDRLGEVIDLQPSDPEASKEQDKAQ